VAAATFLALRAIAASSFAFLSLASFSHRALSLINAGLSSKGRTFVAEDFGLRINAEDGMHWKIHLRPIRLSVLAVVSQGNMRTSALFSLSEMGINKALRPANQIWMTTAFTN